MPEPKALVVYHRPYGPRMYLLDGSGKPRPVRDVDVKQDAPLLDQWSVYQHVLQPRTMTVTCDGQRFRCEEWEQGHTRTGIERYVFALLGPVEDEIPTGN